MTLRPAPPDAEIGRTPHRDRSTSASRAVVVQCVVVSRMSRASPLWVGSTGARVCQGRSVDVAHSCALRVSRNPGIMRNSNVSSNHALISHVRSPPSPHMGARPPHTTITRKAHHSNKKHPPPHKVPSHQKQPHPPHPTSKSVRWARHRSSPPGIHRSRPDSGQTV